MSASLSTPDIDRVRQAVNEVTTHRRPDYVLGRVVREAAHLCGTPLAAMTVRAHGRDQLDLVGVFGTGGVIVERPLPVAHSLNGNVMTSGHSFRSPDVCADESVSIRAIARRNRVRGLLIVPLPSRGTAMGTIAVARRAPWRFSARDEVVLREFARGISIPVEQALSRGAAQRLVPFAQSDDCRAQSRVLRPPAAEASYDPRLPPAVRRHLTARERDVLRLLLADHTCRQIASALGLSQRTVEHYLDRVKLRFGKATLHGLATIVFGERLLEEASVELGGNPPSKASLL